jgi:LuxR family transcriptional regulator, maltose regulon positive regulatory protein
MKARVRIAQGELAEAADWARERGVSASDEVSYLSEFDHLTLVRLLIARHDAHHAVPLLDRLLHAAATSARAGSVAEIHMLQALAHDAQGDRSQAREMLGRAWAAMPEPEGYARLFLDEGAAMTDLLRDAERHGVAADHARRVLGLAATPGPGPADVGHRPAASSAGLLTERELQVLRLLDSELNGPEIARALFVSHNTLRTHTKHIFTKLEVTTRRAAIRRARDRGLL